MSSSIVNVTASAGPEARRRPSATEIGLAIGFGIPFLVGLVDLVFDYFGWAWGPHIGAPWLLGELLIGATILALVRYWEQLPLASIGFYRPSASDFMLGIGAFLILMLAMIAIPPICSLFYRGAAGDLAIGFEPLAPGVFTDLRAIPLWLALAIVVVAGFTTELAVRGYGIERLRTLTGSVVLGAAAAFFLDLIAHLPIWGFRYTIMFAPVEIGLIALYSWKRRLVPCIVASVLMGISGFVILSLQATNPSPSDHLLSGHDLFFEGKSKASIKELDAAIAADPNDVNAYLWRGSVYIAAQDYDRAIADLSKAIRLGPDSSDGYRLRGYAYLYQHDLAHAAPDADAAIKLAPKTPDAYDVRAAAYDLRAWIEGERGDFSVEIADLNTAIRLAPDDRGLIKHRAEAYSRHGDRDRALFDYSWMIALDPKNDDAHRYRATEYALMHDYQRATSEIDSAIKLAPNDVENFATRAQIDFVQKKNQDAIADYNAALKLQPNNLGLLWRRASVYQLTGDYARGLADCNKMIALEPHSGDGYDCRAGKSQMKGDLRNAAADIERGQRLDPNNPGLLIERGSLEAQNGNYADAIRDFDAAIRLNPNNSIPYGQRGVAYESEGNYERAIEDFDEGIKLKPNQSELYGERGLAYSDKGNVQLALQDYATAIRMKPDAEANYVNRAGTYIYQLKDYDRALADLDIALKLAPNDAYSYSLRGEAWYMKKDYKRAIADLDAAIKLDPKDPDNYKLRADAESQLRWAWLP